MSADQDDTGPRRTTVSLTVEQLQWVKREAVARRCSANDVIAQALVAAGAPSGP